MDNSTAQCRSAAATGRGCSTPSMLARKEDARKVLCANLHSRESSRGEQKQALLLALLGDKPTGGEYTHIWCENQMSRSSQSPQREWLHEFLPLWRQELSKMLWLGPFWSPFLHRDSNSFLHPPLKSESQVFVLQRVLLRRRNPTKMKLVWFSLQADPCVWRRIAQQGATRICTPQYGPISQSLGLSSHDVQALVRHVMAGEQLACHSIRRRRADDTPHARTLHDVSARSAPRAQRVP